MHFHFHGHFILCVLTPSNICLLRSSVTLLLFRQRLHRLRGLRLYRPSVVILRQWPLTWTHTHTHMHANRHTCKGQRLRACRHCHRQPSDSNPFSQRHTQAHLWVRSSLHNCVNCGLTRWSASWIITRGSLPPSHLIQVVLTDKKTTAENEMTNLWMATLVTPKLSLTGGLKRDGDSCQPGQNSPSGRLWFVPHRCGSISCLNHLFGDIRRDRRTY